VLPQEGRTWIELGETVAEGQARIADLPDESCEYAIQIAGDRAGWEDNGVIYAVQQIFHVYWELPENEYEAGNEKWEAERQQQVILLRCIFGNPFRPLAIDPAWRTPPVLALARSAYEERTLPEGTLDAGRLAVLADALEEAGCDNEEVLAHLRRPGPHVRGCLVIDLVLGKK
jgi:hypothetical protein